MVDINNAVSQSYHPVLDTHITSQRVTWITAVSGFMARTLSSPRHGACAYPTLTSDDKKHSTRKFGFEFSGGSWNKSAPEADVPVATGFPEARKRYKAIQASTVPIQAPGTWLDLPSLDRQNLLFLRSVQHRSCFHPGLFFNSVERSWALWMWVKHGETGYIDNW